MASSIFSWELLLLQSKTIEMDGIGRVLLVRSKRARRLNISVKPFAGARVAVPSGLSFESAEKIALSKARWIKRHLDKVKDIEKRQAAVSHDLPEIDRAFAGKLELTPAAVSCAVQRGEKMAKEKDYQLEI